MAESVHEKHREAAESVLDHDEYGHLIGGEWVDSESGEVSLPVDQIVWDEREFIGSYGMAPRVRREIPDEGWQQDRPRQHHLGEL